MSRAGTGPCQVHIGGEGELGLDRPCVMRGGSLPALHSLIWRPSPGAVGPASRLTAALC